MNDLHWDGREYVGVLTFDADELRNIAHSLGLRDLGAREMLNLADRVDRANGALDDEVQP